LTFASLFQTHNHSFTYGFTAQFINCQTFGEIAGKHNNFLFGNYAALCKKDTNRIASLIVLLGWCSYLVERRLQLLLEGGERLRAFDQF
jgi:hypothetical protein